MLMEERSKGFEFRNNERRIGEQIFDVTDFRSQWRQACDALKHGIFNKETRSYRGMKPQNSIFKRYAITDKRMVRDAFEQMRKRNNAIMQACPGRVTG
jgi:hypothetical protein